MSDIRPGADGRRPSRDFDDNLDLADTTPYHFDDERTVEEEIDDDDPVFVPDDDRPAPLDDALEGYDALTDDAASGVTENDGPDR